MPGQDLCSNPAAPAEAPPNWEEDASFLSAIVDTQSEIAGAALDLLSIMQLVAERTQKLAGADGASVQLVEGDHLTYRGASGVIADQFGRRLSLTSSLAGCAVRAGRCEYCEDVDGDSRVDRGPLEKAGVRSMVVAPFCLGARVVGVLNVVSRTRAAFGPRDVSALRLLGGLVAAAIAHAGEFDAKKNLLAERTQALAELRDLHEQFHSAFDHAAIGMALVGLDGRWIRVNSSLCQIVGYSEAELLVTNFQSITHPDDLNADMAHARRLVAGELRDYQMVKRYVHRQGHVVWVAMSVSLVRDADGKPRHYISQIQDITRRKQTEDALRVSEEEYRATFELAGVGKAQVDLETGRFVRVNGKLCAMLGYSADELMTRRFIDITYPDDMPATLELVEKMRSGVLQEFSGEKRYLRKDGRVIWIILNATTVGSADGRPARAVSTILDVTERKLAEELERDRRGVLEMVAQDMPLPDVLGQLAVAVERQAPGSRACLMALQDGEISLHGPNLAPEWADALSGSALRLTAALSSEAWDAPEGFNVTFPRRDEIWKNLQPIAARLGVEACWTFSIHGADAPLGALILFPAENRRPTTAEAQTLDMTAKLAAICIEHHQTTRQLCHLVRHDSLTGLPNRLMFADRLQQALDLARRSRKRVGLLAMDVDRFKSVNDTHGHQVGDHLLQQFAQRLHGQLRVTDTIARVGGDEFMVVLPEMESRENVEFIARKLVACLERPFALGEQTLTTTGSIGIAIFPDDAQETGPLQQAADNALYRVKRNGRNACGF